eukprot:scaffold4840_cov115-Isochrysis_galbana.AAC.4
MPVTPNLRRKKSQIAVDSSEILQNWTAILRFVENSTEILRPNKNPACSGPEASDARRSQARTSLLACAAASGAGSTTSIRADGRMAGAARAEDDYDYLFKGAALHGHAPPSQRCRCVICALTP